MAARRPPSLLAGPPPWPGRRPPPPRFPPPLHPPTPPPSPQPADHHSNHHFTVITATLSIHPAAVRRAAAPTARVAVPDVPSLARWSRAARASRTAAAAHLFTRASGAAAPSPAAHRRCRPPPWVALLRAHPRLSPPGGQRPPGRAVEAIRAFCTTSRRDELENDAEIAPRRSDFALVFPEIRPLDRRFLRSVTISFRGANFVSLYLLHRSSVWRATSSGAKLDSVASVGPPLYLSAVQVIEASTFSDHFISCLELYSCFRLLYLMLSRHYHGLVLYGSLHAMLSPSGASGTLCHVRFTFIMYSCAFTIHVHSCESCTLMFTEPSCILSCAPF
ncbi:putative leucine-rich repeat extensin-like protein 3 [Iris pallida]|uniref:Leucine-rich repeat extensin-like protein 3 n=2 Tax=Iris pallida TaxID=29817 RepID=A0AAX6GA21_IRIPA|nr:putative leucine-rich repeat extensin-like protein 3 [Iris pallida]